MGLTDLPLTVLLQLGVVFAVLAAALFALAPGLSEFLIRFRAGRLPSELGERFGEEWMAEVRAIEPRARKLAFAIGIAVTRTKALVDADAGAAFVDLAPGTVLSVEDVRVYSDFGSRLPAFIIDVVIASSVLFALQFALQRAIRPGLLDSLYLTLFLENLWLLGIQTYFVQRFGGSPGKLLLKMRIVSMDGNPLSWRQALVRAAPAYVLAMATMSLSVYALSQLDLARFEAAGQEERQRLFLSVVPVAVRWTINLLELGWTVANICVFIDSFERRALHDVIAGTVVVLKVPRVVTAADSVSPRGSTSSFR